jgi:hypothetical protein
VVLLLIAIGVLLALVSPDVPDPLSIPGKNVVVFAIFLLVMFSPHALLVSRPSLAPAHEAISSASVPERLALMCSRLI